MRKPSMVYLYTSDRPPKDPEKYYDDYVRNPFPTNRFAQTAESDGMIHLWRELVRLGHLERVNIFIDSKRGLGTKHLDERVTLHVVPSINMARHALNPGDILFVRGGFKPWLPLINEIRDKRENWILFYRANTSNSRWPFWDIVMDDLIERPAITVKGKFIFPFTKPVNEAIFHPDYAIPKTFDICVGASHIHKKKGQYKTLQAAERYNQLRPHNPLKLIMPGGRIRCGMNAVIDSLAQVLDLTEVGGLPREELQQFMNGSKIFVHSGVGGQNDRGVLEAMACGLCCVITSPKRFSPFVSRWPNTVAKSQEPDAIAKAIDDTLSNKPYIITGQHEISQHYYQCNGLYEVAIPKMGKVIDYIIRNPKPGSGSWMISIDSIKAPFSKTGDR